MNLKGKVKSYSEKHYFAKEGAGINLSKYDEKIEFNFNKDGNLSKVFWFYADGDTAQKVISEYDKNGKLATKSMYDDMGRFSKKSIFVYDEKGRATLTEFWDSANVVIQRQTIEYNDENLIETEVATNSQGKLLQRVVRQMSKKGLPSEVRIYDDERKLVNYRKEEYNEKDQLVSFKVLAEDEETVVLSATLQYDAWGNLVERKATDENGEDYLPEKMEYEFDSHKNWVKESVLVGDELHSVMVREIEYY